MHVEARPGRYVMLTVADTGVGIPPETLSRIFDPFFTTKEEGKGTGLGLSTALTIVRSHGGFVNVYSEPRKGTQFALYLPALAGGTAEHAGRAQTKLPQGDGELIPVVDDEDAIRQITKGTLETFGYRVLVAADGTEAVALYAQVRVIAASGLAGGDRNTGAAAHGAELFLPKPYTAEKLLKALAQVLKKQ